MAKHHESKLQQSCVKWFDYQYSALRMNLFVIPNGGRRGKIEAGIMKGEGVRAGVADMFLAVPEFPKGCAAWKDGNGVFGMFIEFKYGKGKQSINQKQFESAVTKQGYRYEIISDFDSFKNLVNQYLN